MVLPVGGDNSRIIPRNCVVALTIGTLRSTTATSTKTSPQNRTLLNHKSVAIIQSRSRRTMWAKYPKNKLVRAVSD